MDLNCPITFKLELGSGNKEPIEEMNEKLIISISKFAQKKILYSKNVNSNLYRLVDYLINEKQT